MFWFTNKKIEELLKTIEEKDEIIKAKDSNIKELKESLSHKCTQLRWAEDKAESLVRWAEDETKSLGDRVDKLMMENHDILIENINLLKQMRTILKEANKDGIQ